MIDVYAKEYSKIKLGRVGENGHTRVVFDISKYLDEYPGCEFIVLNSSPGDDVAYPVFGIEKEDSNLYWIVTSSDLINSGIGRCELICTLDSVVVKSEIFTTVIYDALDDGGEAPEPFKSWQEEFVKLESELSDITADVEVLESGEDPTVEYSEGNFTFGLPKAGSSAKVVGTKLIFTD